MQQRFNVIVPDGNRKQRRKAERYQAQLQTRSTRPLRKRQINNMNAVLARVTILTTEERRLRLAPAVQGFQALRAGVATWLQWAAIASIVAEALSIEDLGIMRGMRGHFDQADHALAAIRSRAESHVDGSGWGHIGIPHLAEIDLIEEAIDLHRLQLKTISFAELAAASAHARKEIAKVGGGIEIPASRDMHPLPIQEILL